LFLDESKKCSTSTAGEIPDSARLALKPSLESRALPTVGFRLAAIMRQTQAARFRLQLSVFGRTGESGTGSPGIRASPKIIGESREQISR